MRYFELKEKNAILFADHVCAFHFLYITHESKGSIRTASNSLWNISRVVRKTLGDFRHPRVEMEVEYCIRIESKHIRHGYTYFQPSQLQIFFSSNSSSRNLAQLLCRLYNPANLFAAWCNDEQSGRVHNTHGRLGCAKSCSAPLQQSLIRPPVAYDGCICGSHGGRTIFRRLIVTGFSVLWPLSYLVVLSTTSCTIFNR